jgi:RND family efflux transporter MFP subunit
MNTHIQKIIGDGKDILSQIKSWFIELSRIKKILVIVLVVLIILALGRAIFSKKASDEAVKAPRIVTLSLVSDLTSNKGSIPLLGIVTSRSEATIRAESGGKLTRVYKKLGDNVVAGEIIAEFENSSERATLLQAEGAYEAAKASRDIALLNSGQTSSSLSDTKSSALNALSSAYTTMDDAVRVKTDVAFANPRNQDAKIALSVPDVNLVYSVESKRKAIELMLIAREARNKTLTTSSDLVAELTTAQSEAQAVKSYLDDLALLYAKAVPDTSFTTTSIATQQSIITLARTLVSATVSSITGTRTSLTSGQTAEAIAGKTVTTSENAQIATVNAGVKSAQGAYNAALSRLEKTIIRSPITGTINSLSVDTGDFVSAFSQVAVISNNGALEVVSYVTDEDAKTFAIGNTVIIDNQAKGVITRVASAIDPLTKKIEIRIGITEGQNLLTNGQSVRIAVTRSKVNTKSSSNDHATIPLSALKITPKGSFVFTLDNTHALVAHKVEIGAILGDSIQILSGTTDDMQIVVDARGLKDGMQVSLSDASTTADTK